MEPSRCLATALQSVGWSVRRNLTCLRASHWPHLDPEDSYKGVVELNPQDSFPLIEAVFTDGSLTAAGGAAAICCDTDSTLLARIPQARSSTHCELVALCLALQLSPPTS